MKNPLESGCAFKNYCKGYIDNCIVLATYKDQVERKLDITGSNGRFVLGPVSGDTGDLIENQSSKAKTETSDCIAKKKIDPLKMEYKKRLKRITSQ